MLSEKKGAKIEHLPVSNDGYYDCSQLEKHIHKRTRLVALQHMSNVLGTIHEDALRKIEKRTHDVGARLLIDGAQAAPHLNINVEQLNCDFYVLSAHKMLGPTGLGVLYGKKELLEQMPPFMGGGDMILSAHKDSFKPAPLPNKFEAGTPNIAAAIAFAPAIRYLQDLGMQTIENHERSLSHYMLLQIRAFNKRNSNILDIYGPYAKNILHSESHSENMEIEMEATCNIGAIFSLNLKGIHSHDIASVLDDNNIAVRAGHHCCQPWMEHAGLSSTLRASLYFYNTFQDIDRFIQGLQKAADIFK